MDVTEPLCLTTPSKRYRFYRLGDRWKWLHYCFICLWLLEWIWLFVIITIAWHLCVTCGSGATPKAYQWDDQRSGGPLLCIWRIWSWDAAYGEHRLVRQLASAQGPMLLQIARKQNSLISVFPVSAPALHGTVTAYLGFPRRGAHVTNENEFYHGHH